MKTHMKTHSYKVVQYQCNKCQFLERSEIEIVHSGKTHGDCLNAVFVNTLHQTWKLWIFQCNTCETIFKNLGDLKSQFVKEHESSSTHTKQNRENEDEYDSIRYTYKEMLQI